MITNKVKGPILSDSQIKEINTVKETETKILTFIDSLKNSENLSVDPRWLAIGKTEIEKGFMCVVKSISLGENKVG